MKKIILVAATSLFLIFPIAGYTAQAGLVGKVTQVLIDDVNFGGCMAAVSVNPSTVLAGCLDPWVTFSCTGDFNSVSAGNTKLAAAQLSLVTDTLINLTIDDSKKHNGFCLASRIDNTKLN